MIHKVLYIKWKGTVASDVCLNISNILVNCLYGNIVFPLKQTVAYLPSGSAHLSL